jgi:hypothetical protein
LLLVALAAAAAVPATAASTAKVPAALVGSWSRTVPGSGRVEMSIASGGDLAVAEVLGTISSASGFHRVAVGGFCGNVKGVYSWKVTGRKLTLTRVHESCAAAARVLPGVWTRY